jgi:hypothetical protein
LRKPRSQIPTHPLDRQSLLTRGDVLMLSRGLFWPEAEAARHFPGWGMAAAFALALLGVPLTAIAAIEHADALPAGRPRSVTLSVNRRRETVELNSLAVHAVRAWQWVRPATTSTRLFVTLDGTALSCSTLRHQMRRAGTAVGLAGSLADHARQFLVDSFYRHPEFVPADAAALRRWLQRLDGHLPVSRATPAQLRLVLGRTDPFPDAGASFFANARTIEAARTLGTALPETYVACFRPTGRGRPLPDEHPLLADLANAGRSDRGRLLPHERVRIYGKHRDDLARRAVEGGLPHRDAAALFELHPSKYWLLRQAADPGKPPRPAGAAPPGLAKPKEPEPVKDRREVAALSENDRARVRRIAALRWPARARRPAFRRHLLRQHGGFLVQLARQGMITGGSAAKLLKTDRIEFSRMRRDYEAGTFAHWLHPRPSRANCLMWRTLVYAKRHERGKGQPAADFIRELRRRYGLPISERVARKALQKPPSEGANRKHPLLVEPLSASERARLDRIAGAAGPQLTERARLELLRQHGAFVFDLIAQGRRRVADAQRLFGISAARALDLLCLHRENDLALALDWLSPAQRQRRRAIFVREFERRGADAGTNELCRDIRRRLRLYIPQSLARRVIGDLTRRDGQRPKGLPVAPMGRCKVMVPLTAAEQRRAKRLAAWDWNAAEGDAAIRRQLFAQHGDFLMTMIEHRKLAATYVAALVHLAPGTLSGVRSDWRAGLAARHCQEPPSGIERQRQIALVRREVRPGEQLESLIRRTGQDRGILLPRQTIRNIRAEILATF